MVEDYSARLKQAMDAAGVDIPGFSKSLGISYQALRKALNGGRLGMQNHAKAAKMLGVSGDWLATGKGERKTTNAPAPTKGDVYEAPTADEWVMLTNYRKLLDKDRRKFDEDIAKLADERQAEFDEFSARYGVSSAADRAHARRSRTASTTVDPADPRLKQKPLFDAPDEA